MTGGAAGRVLLDGQDAGSGFAITRTRALTAGHVVRAAARMAGGLPGQAGGPPGPVLVCVEDGEPAAVPAVVAYQPEDAEPIPVTRIEVSTSLDVAVLHLQQPAPAVLPVAGQVTAGAAWRVETRPGCRDSYTLTGAVTDPRRRLWNEGGRETTLIQLLVEQQVGDYKGYSGSPVIAASASGVPGGVLGVLVEQGRWRTRPQLGEEPPVANVLFAAPLEQVLTEFDLAGVPVARSPRQIPLRAPYEVDRPDKLDQVIDALLTVPTEPSPGGQLVGLAGMGGTGKSVLAAAAARDPKVEEAFPAGRFWLELGQDPPLLQLQASLAAALGDSTPITDVPRGRARLSRLLGGLRCLLVLDNVQDPAHVSAFNVMGPAGRMLVTTRDAGTVPGATVIPLGELGLDAAMRLLAGGAGAEAGQLPQEAALVARECGYLPLALAVCGALVSAGSHWPQLLGLLRDADLDALRFELEDYPHPSLAVALAASIDTLPPFVRDWYLRLAVFSGQGPVPAAAVQVLWGLDRSLTALFIGNLARKSLLRSAAGRVSLHDLQMDYLARRAPDLPALHDQLLAAYRQRCPSGWAVGPDDGYFYQHLTYHLHQAGRLEELQALLLDLDWITAKLTTRTIPGLLADYDTLSADPALRLVAAALRLSAHILAGDPGQLPSQLTGRLASHTDPQLRNLLQRTRHWPTTPWLRPLTASLIPPGGPLMRTLGGVSVAISGDGRRAVSRGFNATWVWDLDTGEPVHTLAVHAYRVEAVAISADGRRAVFGSPDGTAPAWDLDTGTLLHTLTGHEYAVRAVAVNGDGRRAISGGDDGTVRAWDLDTGTLQRTLTGHDGTVTGVAVSADGRRAISGGDDGTVRAWDLDTGTLLHTLTGHHSPVTGVAVSADGRRAISGGDDGTVRAWDLDTGTLQHTLTGHDGRVTGVAVSGDGRRAISGGDDGTVRVWDLDTWELVHTLPRHDPWVFTVAVSGDGRRAVSGGFDGTRVWDLDTGELQHTPDSHDGTVAGVAVSADGRRGVSGGDDGTVRAWDLDTGTLLHTLTGHDGKVTGVAVSADGRRGVSGGDDGTVRAWDLDTGTLLHTLTGHHSPVAGVAVSADGRRAVSGGDDGTVRAWDLDTGTLLHTLARHDSTAGAVAVSVDGRRAVSGGDHETVRAWDTTTGKRVVSASKWPIPLFLRRFFGVGFLWSPVQGFSVSADGRRAVSGCLYGPVLAWDLEAGKPLYTLVRQYSAGGGKSVAVSGDGRRAVFGGHDGTVRAWDLDTGTLLHALTGHRSPVTRVSVSGDGRRAVSSDSAKTVRVWDLERGVEIARFVSDSEITAIATTPPGTRVIAGTSAGPVHVLVLCGYE